MYTILYSHDAVKDIERLKTAKLDKKAQNLIDVLRRNPFETPPPYEKLQVDLNGFYSRRINIKHRLIYQVFEGQQKIRIIRMWTHYEG